MPNETDSVNRVGIKYAPFWRANPSTWFSQLESQFVLAGVTSSITRYHHLVAALQPEELAIVGDILSAPPKEDPYAALKTRLINQYEVSEDTRLRELISGMQLGDKKPSRLLLEMRSKAGEQVSDELLKTLFLQRLPQNVQQILAISGDKLDKLAEMADGIMAAAGPPTYVQTVREDDGLKALILDISARLERLEASNSGVELRRPRSRSRDFRGRGRSRIRHNSVGNDSFCWYHATFGVKANKCRDPCNWSGNE